MVSVLCACLLTDLAAVISSDAQGRRLVSDFGMFVALLTMVVVAYLVRDLITVETLVVTRWTPSDPTVRGWFINPFGGKVSVGAGFGALLPALLVSDFVWGHWLAGGLLTHRFLFPHGPGV